jgi:hypothetical protein
MDNSPRLAKSERNPGFGSRISQIQEQNPDDRFDHAFCTWKREPFDGSLITYPLVAQQKSEPSLPDRLQIVDILSSHNKNSEPSLPP